MTPQQRFWKKVNRTTNHNDCWEWQGATNSRNYGTLVADKKAWLAHRYSYTINKGQIPHGYQIMHTCDNTKCVNPNHLTAATQKTNMKDMVNKGRHAEHKTTHCPQGHEYTEENTYRRPSRPNQRLCRTCIRNRNKQRPPRTEYNRQYWKTSKWNPNRTDKSN